MRRIRKLILVLIAIAAVIVLYKPFVNASLEYQENRRRILREKAAAEAQMAAAEEETEKELTAICKEYGGKSAVLYIEKTKKTRTAKIVINEIVEFFFGFKGCGAGIVNEFALRPTDNSLYFAAAE